MVSSFSLCKGFTSVAGRARDSFPQIEPKEFGSLLHRQQFIAGSTEHERQASDGVRIGAEYFENLPLVHVRQLALGLENAPRIAPSTNIENFVCSGFPGHAVVSWSDVH
jgi:hypothetical protein